MGLIEKGDFVVYSVTGNVGTKQVQGAVGIKVVAVKDNEYMVSVLPKGVPFMKKARLTFPFNGNSLADLGGILAGWSVEASGSKMGSESVSTPFGDRTLERYSRIEQLDNGNLQTEQFVDPYNHFPYAARMSGASGEVLFGIMDTNIPWIKE